METSDSRQTIRQEIIDLLNSEELTIRDLSQAVSLQEKEIVGHLGHIERSLQRQGKKLMISPYKCLTCGFVFEKPTADHLIYTCSSISGVTSSSNTSDVFFFAKSVPG